MNFVEMLGDVINIVKKADNIDLYRQLLDVNKAALDLQAEMNELQIENQILKNRLETERKIVRHSDGLYITLEDDPMEIHYCSNCWGMDNKLIQMGVNGCFYCATKWKSTKIR